MKKSKISKRIRNIILVVIGGFMLVSCGSPATTPGKNNPETTTSTAVSQKVNPVQSTNTLAGTKTKFPATETPVSTATFPPSPTAKLTQTSLATATEQKVIALFDCLPDDAKIETGKVTKIVDGDTIDVEINGAPFRVRYIGIDTPERERPLYEEARTFNSDLVLNKEVVLVKDISETDPFDRLLRYVIVGDVFVNAELVKEGLAAAEDYPPDSACSSTLSTAMGNSRSAQIGLWEATQTPEASGPKVVIVSVNKKAENVDIQNQGNTDVDLSGWNLVSETGNQDCPLSGVLKAGETLRIWSMAAEGAGYSCGYSKDIWNNSKSDPAVLYNPHGIEVSRY